VVCIRTGSSSDRVTCGGDPVAPAPGSVTLPHCGQGDGDPGNMRRVAVIGAGSWGTALGIFAARAGHQVKLWSRNRDVVSSINREHENPLYLTGTRIPESVYATNDIGEAIDEQCDQRN
jgi:hypothetical protein